MEDHGIYNLSLTKGGAHCRPRRVGLLRERTGIPLFLLFLHEGSMGSHELHSVEDVESHIFRATNLQDKQAWRLLLPFFEGAGTSAYVYTSPLSQDSTNHVADLLGAERSLTTRTGLHAVKGWTEYCDLLVIPQLSSLLNLDQWLLFVDAAFSFLSKTQHYFFLLDLPKNSQPLYTENLNKLENPDAAIYFPWIVRDSEVLPPAPLVAAAFQANDLDNIQDLPANRTLRVPYRPIQHFSPTNLADFLDKRINVIHELAPNDVRIWGAQTLASRRDGEARYISTRRTLTAVKEAIHELCEPFVLEPLYNDLPKIVDVALQSAFQPFRRIFDTSVRDPFRTNVRVIRKRTEDILQVDVQFLFPFALDEINFSLALT